MKETIKKRDTTLPFRMTPFRTALLRVLTTAQSPLSAFEIERRIDVAVRETHKTTVYRNLELFEAAGLVKKTIVNDRTQYYESTSLGHHHHFVCTECERMEDIVLSDQSLIREAERIGKKLGFTLEQHLLEFYGRCTQCMNGKTRTLAP